MRQEGKERDQKRAKIDKADPEAAAEIRVAAGQQDVGDDREEPEEVDGSEIAARRPQPQQPDDADGQQQRRRC